MGKFDGVHRAHREIIARLGEYGGVLVVDNAGHLLTPHFIMPRFINKPIFIYSLDVIKGLDGREFIEKIVEEFTDLERIVVGYDFRFGKERAYCAEDIPTLFDGEVEIVEEIRHGGISVHSGIIKELLRHGDIEEASRLLGREYMIEGARVAGQGIGAKKLLPTINLEVAAFLLPQDGVYATTTTIKGRPYPSVTFIGNRVTTDRRFSVETHIINGTIQPLSEGEVVGVHFLSKLRENHRFATMDALKKQIEQDIMRAKEVCFAR